MRCNVGAIRQSSVGSDVHEWHKHKASIEHFWMRQCQARVLPRLFFIKQEVEVKRARPPMPYAVTTMALLDGLQLIKQCQGGKACFHPCAGIDEIRLILRPYRAALIIGRN